MSFSPTNSEATALSDATRQIHEVDLAPVGQGSSGTGAFASASPSPLSKSQISWVIPPTKEDQLAFARLPENARADLTRLLLTLSKIHVAKNKQAACKLYAATTARRGFSAPNLYRHYYNFIKTGNWRVLVNKAVAGPDWWETSEQIGLPEPFVQYFKGLCERNQRKCLPAWRELIRTWKTKTELQPDGSRKPIKKIPGYNEWPTATWTGLPRGWSQGNLNRFTPDSFELAAARQGREAASQFRRRVFSTRVGLKVGQFYLFDDQEYDLKVNFMGRNNRRAMRPLGLNCLDLFSACCFAFGFKPTLWDSETETKKKLREEDMFWFVAHILMNFGYRTDDCGTTFIVEHGTAAINDTFAERINQATAGKVRIERSGIGGEAAFPGLFEGASKGNPRFKAALESFFNLVRNETAFLPGQVGLDRNHHPVEMHGRDRYNNALLKAAAALPPERAALLKFPVLEWTEFEQIAMDIYSRINDRLDHALEGWQESRLFTKEWRLADSHPWSPIQTFLALPAPQQTALATLIESDPSLCRSRKLSPAEVFHQGKQQLTKLPSCMLPVLLGVERGYPVNIVHGYITIKDKDIDADPLRFPVGHGLQSLMQSGTLGYLNPFNPVLLVLADSQGRYIGETTLQETPNRADVESLKRQMGAAKKEEADRLAPVAARAADLARAKTQMHRHNTDVLDGKPITQDEIDRHQQLKENKRQYAKEVLSVLQSETIAPEPSQTEPATNETLLDSIL